MVLAVWSCSIMDFLHSWHHLVAHIQPQIPHSSLFYKLSVFLLPFPCSRTDPIPSCLFFRGELVVFRLLRRRLSLYLLRNSELRNKTHQ